MLELSERYFTQRPRAHRFSTVSQDNRQEPDTMPNDDGVANVLRRYAAFLGATGVGAGAFGAHGLKDILNNRGAIDNWRTAVMYQLFHATALLGAAGLAGREEKDKPNPNIGTAGKLMVVGTVLFSGSIYCLSLGVGPKKILGPTTPIGGLLLIAGWVMVGI